MSKNLGAGGSDLFQTKSKLKLHFFDLGSSLTLGSKYNGMESAAVVFVYSNPFSSNFRANYMRVSVELILIDRHNMDSAPLIIVNLAVEFLCKLKKTKTYLVSLTFSMKRFNCSSALFCLLSGNKNYSWSSWCLIFLKLAAGACMFSQFI